jgi:diaminohydroxyphosphoribosylaminopyrimidine deaminase/5-amino-6-(5-phosphoribosylamino)uracil reductase
VDTDEQFMRRALRLAERARGRTAPNPMVGAVVVAAGEIVGEGWHPRAGEPHAEVFALRNAGERARGATLYVTLEPCAHHGRTPPCVDAVLAAGVSHVVAAMRDPNPQVAGGGLRRLTAAGVSTSAGLLEAEARDLNRAWLKAIETGLPWVTLKMAMTLDGKIATRTGDSRWVTGESARRHVHRLRNWNDAVLVGIGTARADDPQLTARVRGARNPVRVVVDPRAELPAGSHLARTAGEVPTWLAASAEADTTTLERSGVTVLRVPHAGGRLDLDAVLRELVRRDVHSVLCEGGAGLAGYLLDAGLVDEAAWFIAPKLAGGAAAPGPVAGAGVERMAEAVPLDKIQVRRFGEDVAVFGRVRRRG